MISVFNCPQCKSQLGVDPSLPHSAEVECPLCTSRFILKKIYPDNLPRVKIIDPLAGNFDRTVASETNKIVESDTSSDREIDATELEELPWANRSLTDDAGGLVTQSTLPTSSINTANTARATTRRTSPIIHLLGIIFFGVVGLFLGFVVLCFFGKAEAIIQLLPENSLQGWLEEMNHLGGSNQR